MLDRDNLSHENSAGADEAPVHSAPELAVRNLDAELNAERIFLEPAMVLNDDVAQASVARDAELVMKLARAKFETDRVAKTEAIKLERFVSVSFGIVAVTLLSLLVAILLRMDDLNFIGVIALTVFLIFSSGMSIISYAVSAAEGRDLVTMTVDRVAREFRWEHQSDSSLDVPVLLVGRKGIAFRLKGQAFYTGFSSVRGVSADTRPSLKAPVLNISLDLSHLPEVSPTLDLAMYAPKSSVGETEAAIANHIATIVAASVADK